MNRNPKKVFGLHLAILLVLFLMQFVLPAYHHTTVARVMVLASFAVGYNILLGYTGLMSLGHAMFFSAGMYGAGLGIYHLGLSGLQGFGAGLLSALLLPRLPSSPQPLRLARTASPRCPCSYSGERVAVK